jgi:hypothetical protein
MELILLAAVGSWLLCAWLGKVVGGMRGQAELGLLLGLLLGPLGVLVAVVLPESRGGGGPAAGKREHVARRDPMAEWEAAERAKTPLPVPEHLRGKRVEDE